MERVDFSTLREFFKTQKNIFSVFVFGSSQNGEINTGSDLDVAILFQKAPSANEKLEIYSRLCDILKLEARIDMVVLNQVNTILAFEAITGKRVLDNNPEKTAEFCSYTSRVYEDVMANIEYQLSLPQGN